MRGNVSVVIVVKFNVESHFFPSSCFFFLFSSFRILFVLVFGRRSDFDLQEEEITRNARAFSGVKRYANETVRFMDYLHKMKIEHKIGK